MVRSTCAHLFVNILRCLIDFALLYSLEINVRFVDALALRFISSPGICDTIPKHEYKSMVPPQIQG